MHWNPDGTTWYDINQVDGYNLPVTMESMKITGGNCHSSIKCRLNMKSNCPAKNRIMENGVVVACKIPIRDTANTNYARIKQACPDAYLWSKDDVATKSCSPGNPGLKVTFC